MLSGKTRSFRDVGRALKAQNQCRIAVRVLLALRAAMDVQKKSRNRTNELLEDENSHRDQDLGRAASEPRSCPDKAPAQGLVARTRLEQPPCLRQRRGNPPQRLAIFHSIDIGPVTPALIPSAPTNIRGIASPAAARRRWIQRAPRRRWR